MRKPHKKYYDLKQGYKDLNRYEFYNKTYYYMAKLPYYIERIMCNVVKKTFLNM